MAPVAHTGSTETVDSPWARRLQQARWRDPRLLLGVLLVLVSVLAGARLLAAADDYALVWAAKRDLPVGAALAQPDLQARAVRFRDQGDADRYLSAEQPLAGAVLARPLGAGELVPAAALAAPGQSSFDELPLAVAQTAAPVDLREGDVVDVWVVPSADSVGASGARIGSRDGTTSSPAQEVLSSVVVVSAGGDTTMLGSSGVRTVVVGVDDAQGPLSSVLPALAAGDVVLVRQGA